MRFGIRRLQEMIGPLTLKWLALRLRVLHTRYALVLKVDQTVL
jgi:hypothetical protein